MKLVTLPDLQALLDQLVPDQELSLATVHVERLFGVNEVATGRLKNFATGHGCIFAWSGSGARFRKLSAPRQAAVEL